MCSGRMRMRGEGHDVNERAEQNRLARMLSRLVAFGSGKRKWLVRVGIPAAVLAVLVGVPGFIASQPGFLGRYARLDGVYGTWERSVHAKVPCQRCHVRPDVRSQLTYDLRMAGEFYLSLAMPGREPDLYGEPPNEACQSCHMDMRTVSPKGDLNIPHRAHVSVLRMKCVDCHDYLVHKATPAGKHTPPMAGCLKCHDGRRAKNACSACHTEKSEPLTHRTAEWLVVHPEKANAECNTCHAWTQKWCADCHAKRPRSHGTDWRSKHRLRIDERRNCEACHVGEFCVRCHGEVPSRNANAALKLVD